MALDLKKGDWVECQGMFSFFAKIKQIFVDSFEGNFFFKKLDGKTYVYLGINRFSIKMIDRKLTDQKLLEELEALLC